MVEHLSWSCADDVFLAIEMLDLHCDTSQCLDEGDLLGDDEIGSPSLEGLMLLDLDADVDIASNDSGLNEVRSTY